MSYDDSSLVGDEIVDNFHEENFISKQTPVGWFFYKLWGYSFDYINNLIDKSIKKQYDNIENKSYLGFQKEKLLKLIPSKNMSDEDYKLFTQAVSNENITHFSIKNNLAKYLKCDYDDIKIVEHEKPSITASSFNSVGDDKVIGLKEKYIGSGVIDFLSRTYGEVKIKYPDINNNSEKIERIKKYIGVVIIHFEKYKKEN